DVKRTAEPSGVKPSAMSLFGCNVSRFGTPPAVGTTNTSVLPSYRPVKAIIDPSGENFGPASTPGCDVRRRTFVPSRLATQRSFAYAKAMWSLLTAGSVSRRVALMSIAYAASAQSAAVIVTKIRFIGTLRLDNGPPV